MGGQLRISAAHPIRFSIQYRSRWQVEMREPPAIFLFFRPTRWIYPTPQANFYYADPRPE